MRRQDDGAALHRDLDEVPEIPLRSWIQARRRLVQQHHRGAADQRHRDRQLALHAPRQAARRFVGVVGQADDGERLLRGVARVSFDVDAPEPREETQMVSAAQVVPEDVLLVDDAERARRVLEVGQHALPRDLGVAGRRLDGAADHRHGRRLPGAVRA